MRKLLWIALLLAVSVALCPASGTAENEKAPASDAGNPSEDRTSNDPGNIGEDTPMRMKIGETEVAVEWENNESVTALQALCEEQPLRVPMSMYGGFEQVGSLGKELPSNDVQTTTSAGDIVLYSSDRIVVFYGSNSWAYTRLGRITDRTPDELAALLSQGDVTLTLDGGKGK